MTAPVLMVTGATGFIGRRLLLGFGAPWHIAAASRRATGKDTVALDLADPESLVAVFDAIGPTAVVHAGGIADPDACEREPELARRVNVEAVKVLARLCATANARLVHFSTDLVFGGENGQYSEDDAPRPISTYGLGKLESEEFALALCPGSVVLRVSNCYGRPLGTRPCFVDELRTNLAAGRPMPGFVDQWRTSTAADQLPAVIQFLLTDRTVTGVYHWGGADRASRYEAALTFCRVMGYDERLICPAHASERHFLAPRPRDTSLDSSRLASLSGLAPLGLQEGFAALKKHPI